MRWTILTEAPGDLSPIGGVKVITESGWSAARPSGTAEIYKIYAESFPGEAGLKQIEDEVQSIIGRTLTGGADKAVPRNKGEYTTNSTRVIYPSEMG